MRADDSGGSDQGPTLSDDVGDALAKLEPMIQAKNWDAAIALVDGLIAKADPLSYDAAVLYRTKAQVLTQKGDFTEVREPLEKSVAINDQKHYFTKHEEADLLYFLSQLYYQLADSYKSDHEAELAAYQKAIAYIDRWFEVTPKPSEDNAFYYAQLLYAAAVARDPSHPDMQMVKKAQVQIEKTMRMSLHTKDTYYMFLLATLQQEQDYARGAKVLELLLSHNANNKSYWQDLSMFYMALAQDPKLKDEDRIRIYNIRAINTVERAQAAGYMKTPRDNYTLFTLYYNIGEYGLAADLLHKGLQAGTIDPDLQNWLFLTACYQQINQQFEAIDVLKEAAEKFPTDGELDFRIAQIYQGIDDNVNGYKFGHSAIEKGGLAKPEQTYLFMAYVCYELSKWDEAKAAIDKAIDLSGGKADHQMQGLKGAIVEAIKERDAKKAADQAEKDAATQ
jgi:tetratricopeptide (TPR) repeat protein